MDAEPPAGAAQVEEEEGEFSDSSQEENVEPDELYGAELDDEDEEWVNRHQRKETTRQGKTKGPATDAVLNCPCCFTTLCHDCQRHERYKNQFRAMFFVNCTVKTHVKVTPPPEAKGGKQQQQQQPKGEGKQEEEGEGAEVLHPVTCATCGTEVGVQDEQEVVHFFNVLAS